MNETTQLIVETKRYTDSCDNGNTSHVSASQHSFDSIRASVRIFSESVSRSVNRIGVLGSASIAVNSLTGPAMLCLPATYQRSGLIPTTGMITITELKYQFGNVALKIR